MNRSLRTWRRASGPRRRNGAPGWNSGDERQIAEEVRAVRQWRWLEDARSDIRFALRSLPPNSGVRPDGRAHPGARDRRQHRPVQRGAAGPTEEAAGRAAFRLVEISCINGAGSDAGRYVCPRTRPFSCWPTDATVSSAVFAFSPVPYGLAAVVNGHREIVTAQLTSGNAFGGPWR